MKKRKGLSLRQFIALVSPKYQFYPHVEKLIAVLQRVADGEIHRLMVFMPPRHGKSETISRLFTAYYLYRYPKRWIGLNSYADALASTLSRNARANYKSAGGELNPAAEAVHHWETAQGGGMWAAGVGGPITGKGFHLGVIDDPVKNAKEAKSETIREGHRDWYGSTFLTREEPEAAIVVVQTRWHEDDLSGWLLAQEGNEDDEPERWHIVSMAAIKEHESNLFPDTCTIEPDDRQPGEALCPERYDAHKLRKRERRLGAYYWNALYQQHPTPPDGNMFKRDWFKFVDDVPYTAKRVRWWDVAGTEGDGDYTAGVLMARQGDDYYIEDVVRGQWAAKVRDDTIKRTAEADHIKYHGKVQIWREQEPGSSGKDVAAAFVRMLAGYPARAEPSTGSKEVRADPLAAQAGAGNIKVKRASWNKAYLDEMTAFPYGTNDDQVDGSSGAFNKLALAKQVKAN